MLERWCEKLVQLGKANPKLRWPLVALLALLYGGLALWGKTKALGLALAALSREAAEHLRETGGEISGGLRRLQRWCRDHLPLAMARGREVFHTSRQWCVVHLRAAKTAVPAHLARLKGLGAALARRTVSGVGRMADAVRAEAPALRRHAPRRAMALALTLCMALSLLPAGAIAAEGTTGVDTSVCSHVHDETCGYIEPVEGSPCAHTEHDGNCGYVEAVPEVPCDKGCTDTDGDGIIDHAADCAYTPAVEGSPCKHELGEHDDTCGYIEAVASSPCAHEHDETCGGLINTGDDAYVPPETEEEPEIEADRAPLSLPRTAVTPAVDTANKTIYANGVPIKIVAGKDDDGRTNILYDQNGDGTIADTEYLVIGEPPTATGYALNSYTIYGGCAADDATVIESTDILVVGGRVKTIHAGSANWETTKDIPKTLVVHPVGTLAKIENIYDASDLTVDGKAKIGDAYDNGIRMKSAEVPNGCEPFKVGPDLRLLDNCITVVGVDKSNPLVATGAVEKQLASFSLPANPGYALYLINGNIVMDKSNLTIKAGTMEELQAAVAKWRNGVANWTIQLTASITITETIKVDQPGRKLAITGLKLGTGGSPNEHYGFLRYYNTSTDCFQSNLFAVSNGSTLNMEDIGLGGSQKTVSESLVSVDGTDSTFTISRGQSSWAAIRQGYSKSDGGGVSVTNGGSFVMTNVWMDDCRTEGKGGGVYVDETSSFTMLGGWIKTSQSMQNSGGGVYSGGEFIVGGKAVVSENTGNVPLPNTNTNNVYLPEGKTITLATGDDAPVTDKGNDNMFISVYPHSHRSVIISSGVTEEVAACFRTISSLSRTGRMYHTALMGDQLMLIGIDVDENAKKIYANGARIRISLSEWGDESRTTANIRILDDKSYLKIGDTDPTNNGYDLSGYTIYGGSKGDMTGDTNITMIGGLVKTIYGGSAGNVTGNTNINLTGGTVTDIIGGSEGGSVSGSKNVTVDTTGIQKQSTAVSGSICDATSLTVGGGAVIGSENSGIRMKSGTDADGVERFAIAPKLTGAPGCVKVALPDDYAAGTTIATGAVESDLAKIKLIGGGAAGKAAYFDSDAGTISVIVPWDGIVRSEAELKREIGKFNSGTGDAEITIGASFAVTETHTINSADKTLTIKGAPEGNQTLSRDTAFSGPIFAAQAGTVQMRDLTIDGAGMEEGGAEALVSITGGKFTMETGTILQNNRSGSSAGGVCVDSGQFTMAGGTIGGNTATDGGGVKVGASGVFTMTGGTIGDNTATDGGGVRVDTSGTFTMTGGTISGNTADKGGGVSSQGVFYLGGAAKISDGLYLQRELGVTSALQNNVEIEAMESPAVGAVVASGIGYTITGDDLAKFLYKDSKYAFALGTGSNQIELAAALNPPEITVQPAASTELTFGAVSGSLSVTANLAAGALAGTTLSYRWEQKGAGDAWTAVEGAAADTFPLPTDLDAGEYTYRCAVTAALKEEQKAVHSTEAVVTVGKASMSAATVTPYTGEYDGAAHPAFTVEGAPADAMIKSGTAPGSLSDGALPVTNATAADGATVYYEISHANYTAITGSATYEITPRQLTVSATAAAAAKVYDGTTAAAVTDPGTLGGLAAGESLTLTCTAAYADKAVGADKAVKLQYAIADKDSSLAANYVAPADGSVIADITARELTVSGAAAVGRVYDGTTAVTITGGTLTGMVIGDTVTLGGTPAGSVANAGKGEDKPVTVTGYTITGTDSGNYTLSQPAGLTATITAKPLNAGMIASIPNQPYTGLPIIPVLTVTDGDPSILAAGDFTAEYTANVEIGQATVTLTGRGNYTGTATANFTIESAQLPAGTTNDDIFNVTSEALNKWHKADITLTAKGGWTVGTAATNLDASVTLSIESTKDAGGKVVPSSAELFVKDSAGKLYQTTVAYLLDKTPAVVTVTGETDGEVVGSWGPSREITFHVEDALSGVMFVSHYGNRVGNNTIVEPDLTDDGNYTFTALVSDSYGIQVNDHAGNTMEHTFITQQLDGVKPTAAFGDITGTRGENDWFTGTITVNVLVEDPESTPDAGNTPINESDKSGIAKWEYSLDGGTHWTEGDGTSFAIDEDGNYTDKLKLRATDNAGNVSETATASVKRDRAIPNRPTVTAKAGGEDYGSGAWTAKDVVFTLSQPQYGFTASGLGAYQVKIGDAEWADVTGNTVTHSTNTPDAGVDYEFRIVSVSGTRGNSTMDVTVKRRAVDDSVKNDPANKYGESDFSIDSEGVKDGWYDHDVTVTVTKKENITDGSTSYPADTWYKLDSGEKVKLDGTEITITGDGEHTLEIWTEDASGNETTHLELTVKIDKTAPTISNVAGNPTDWTKDDANITFTAADETSGVKSVVVTHTDGQSVTYTEVGFTADRNGVYTITVTDNAGNTTTETVTVDKIDKSTLTKPTVTGYTSDTWVKEPITFTITTTDTSSSGTKFQVKVGGADWAVVTSPYTVSDNTDGVAYSFRAVSGAGAASETVDFTVKLDKTAPVVSLDVKAGGAAYDGQSFTAHDVVITPGNTASNLSGVTYYYQKAGETDWAELASDALTVDYNCETTFTFKAISGAGADSSNQPTAQVKRSAMSEVELAKTEYGESDFTIAPDKSGEWYTETPTVTVTPKATVGEGGLTATTYYELYKAPAESSDKKELTAPWTIKPDSDGIWTLEVWTEDAAGNKTNPYSITLMVDTTAPTVTDVTGNATAWQNTDVTLTVNDAADATSGLADLAYSFDGGATWQAASAKAFAANASVTVWVRDKAGNTYKHDPIAINKIDKAAPVVTWVAALDANKWYGKTALTAKATDDSGEALTVTLTSGGKPYANGSTIDKSGSYTFYATATDGAGNVGSSEALTVRVETLIDDFVARVDGLSSGSNYQAILDAVNWYNGQSTTIKDRFSKSDDATAAYEKLMGLLRDKAQEAANGVTDAIKDADTIEEIEQAAKDYDSLPDSAKEKIDPEVKKELEQKEKDADAARKVIEQLANADRPKDGKDPGGSYDEKDAAQEAYSKLTDDQKALVNKDSAAVEDKTNIDADLAAIDHVLDLLGNIQKPYTPATKDQIKAAGDAYNALSDKQKDAFPKAEKERLDALEEMRRHAQAVEDKIEALGESPAQSDLNSAKGAYDSLTADEKAMVDGTLKTELDKKYQDMLNKLSADEKAAAEFAAKVEEVKNSPTVEKIKDLIKDHDALSDTAKDKLTDQTKDDYEKLVDDLTAAQPVIDKLDNIDVDHLTPGDMDKVKDTLDAYDNLTGDQKKLVDEATDGKAGILDDAVKGVEDATDKIEDIPGHGAGSSTELPDGTTVPDLGDCENSENEDGSGGSSGGHSSDDHRNAIEEAKIAYEKLTDAGRKLISDEAKEKLNSEYAALMAYLEYINTAKTASTNVEVAGLAEKVELPAESASAPKTVISVVMADSKPAVMPTVPAGKTEALSVDIKLVASIYDNPDATAADTPIAQEQVQPKVGEAVLVKLKVPSGYQNDTLELWHVKDNGGRSRIEGFWLVTESDGVYAVFEVSSFSHFVFFAEKTPTGGNSGGNVTPPTTKPDVPETGNGSTSITPQRPKPGDTVTITPKPDEGYVVDDVTVTDQNGKEIPAKDNGDGSYSYTQPSGKVTITVTFKPEDVRLPWNPFTDVTERDWFHDSVKYVYEQGLMNGTASDKFSPYLDTSRGMIVTILWRLEGEPEATAASPFPDVAEDSYCAKAVAWGAENGIVKGYGNGNFGPNDPITREQMAAILYRYTQFKGLETPTEGMAIGNFSDGGEVSGWARDAMRWCLGRGIVSGKGNNVLDPKGWATRAETAAMLTRYLSN